MMKAICRNSCSPCTGTLQECTEQLTRRDEHLPLACDQDKLPLKVNAVNWRLKMEADSIRVLPQGIVNQVSAELIPENPDVVAILVVNRVVNGHVYVAIVSHHCGFCKQDSQGILSMQDRQTVHIRCCAPAALLLSCRCLCTDWDPAAFPIL